jgi:predicted RNase H-like nuclease
MPNGQTFVAGIDGCRDGWVVVLLELNGNGGVTSESCRRLGSFSDVINIPEQPRFAAIDIPIGLPSAAVPGGRTCDREARQLLGSRRASVFSPPARSVLGAGSYAEAVDLNRASSRHEIGISRQVYNLLPKLRDVHRSMTPELQLRIREVHPELSFTQMNDGSPIEESKHSQSGKELRRELLEKRFKKVGDALKLGLGSGAVATDVLDAYAAAWSAWRMARGKAQRIPDELQLDSQGLRMGIWY